MADIRDWGAFIRGRWDWTRGGYEVGFPRKSQFTDIDAIVEFDGEALMIEGKHWDGEGGMPPPPPTGQRIFLESEVAAGKEVLVLYGCGACNNPFGVRNIKTGDVYNWAGEPLQQRRAWLKYLIDAALKLS